MVKKLGGPVIPGHPVFSAYQKMDCLLLDCEEALEVTDGSEGHTRPLV